SRCCVSAPPAATHWTSPASARSAWASCGSCARAPCRATSADTPRSPRSRSPPSSCSAGSVVMARSVPAVQQLRLRGLRRDAVRRGSGLRQLREIEDLAGAVLDPPPAPALDEGAVLHVVVARLGAQRDPACPVQRGDQVMVEPGGEPDLVRRRGELPAP